MKVGHEQTTFLFYRQFCFWTLYIYKWEIHDVRLKITLSMQNKMREGHDLRSLVYNRVRVWRPPTNTSVPNFPWVPTPPPLPPDGFCIGAVESLTTVLIWDACNWKYYIEIYFWASKVACFIPNLERTIHFLMKLQAYSCRKRKLQCAEKITVKILTRAYDVRFGKELNWELTNYPRKLKMSLMTMQMITKDS